MEPAKIFFQRSGPVRPFLEKVLELFAPKLKGKVLLKPNLVSHEPYPATTDPELFRELIRLLKGRVQLAAGDAAASDLVRPGAALKSHALFSAAREEGIVFHDFYQKEMIFGETGLGDRLKFSAVPQEFDLVISLPVLKAHINVLMTGALKNQFGYLARAERGRVHFSRAGLLARAIVGINRLAPAGLFLVDFRETMLHGNEFRHGGRKAQAGGLFAGTDPVALDWFGFSRLQELERKLFGKRPEELPYLDLAQKSGLGSARFDLVEL